MKNSRPSNDSNSSPLLIAEFKLHYEMKNTGNILEINETTKESKKITLAGKDGSFSAKADSSKSFAHSSSNKSKLNSNLYFFVT